MFLLLFILIQSQQPRLSPFVIAGAVLAFIIGIALLVYFFRRFKASEKEAEEEWSLSRRSLFVSPEPAGQKAEEVAAAQPTRPERIDPAPINAEPINAEAINAAPINRAATEALGSIRTGEIPEVTNEQAARHPRPTEALKAESLPAFDMSPAEVPVREERPTQVLSSIQPEDSVKEAQAVDEATPFDNEVLAGLEMERQQPAQSAPPAAEPDRGTQFFGSDQPWPAIEQDSFEKVNEPRIQPPVEQVEPGREARIGSSTRLEQFEPPRIERMSQREQFEPPVIKPLTPREQSTFIETQRDSSPSEDLYGEPSGYGAKIERKPPEREQPERERLPAAQSSYEDAARRPEPVAPPTIYPAPADRPAEPYLAARQVAPASGGKSRAGSILGLPAEASQGPLILGEPVRSKEERGIDALSHYGKPLEKDGGRGGTIALLAVVLILGGGLVAYFFIPSIHAGINGWVARVRGTDVEEARRAAMIPKAVIYPRFNSEVNKNQIKIKGAVDNIWNEPLENLTVEVTLVRGADASPQIIPVAVSPNPLPPNQRGTFDFEYDGKRDTGFSGYKITKLLSNGNEVRFTSPNTQK